MLRSILSNWVSLVASVAASFVLMPLVVSQLGDNSFGVWAFLTTLLQYTVIMYFGLGATIVRFVAAYHAEDDKESLNRLVSTIFFIYTGLGSICCVAFFIGSPFFAEWAKTDTGDATPNAAVACCLMGLYVLMVFINSCFSGVLLGRSRFDLVNLSVLICLGVRFSLTLFVVRGPNALLILAIVNCVHELLNMMILGYSAFRVVPYLQVKPSLVGVACIKKVYGFSALSFVLLIAETVISSTDSLIISAAFGATMVGYYSIPQQLVNYSKTLTRTTSRVFLPRFAHLHETGDASAVRDLYMTGYRCIFLLAILFAVSTAFLGGPFIKVWINDRYAQTAIMVLPFLTVSAFIRSVCLQLPVGLFQAMNALRAPSILVAIEAVLNLVVPHGRTYFDMLRTRLHWAGQPPYESGS